MDVKFDYEATEKLKIEDDVSNKESFNHEIKEFSEQVPLKRQILATSAVIVLTISSGATAGYSATLLPSLESDESAIKVNTEMKSWVASIAPLAMLLGNVIAGVVMEKFGRRSSLIFLTFPYLFGWSLISLGVNIEMILIGRFLTGVAFGWMGPTGPVFVGEISTPKYRGILLALISFALTFGIFYTHLLGTILHWKLTAFMCGLCPAIALIVLLFVPESPSWFISKGSIDDCVRSFTWYRGYGAQAKTELANMISKHDNTIVMKSSSTFSTLRSNLRKPEFRKPLFVMVPFFVIIQLTGFNVFAAYTVHIMKDLTNNESIDGNSSMLIVDILRVLALICAGVMFRKVGRRPLAMVSGSLTALVLLILSIYLYLHRHHIIKNAYPLLALTLMGFNIFISSVGINTLPWVMVGEVFPSSMKGIGSGISVMMTSVSSFVTVKTALIFMEKWGLEGTFLFYGISTVLGTIFLYCFLPETKGRTLQQVEEGFNNSKCKSNQNT